MSEILYTGTLSGSDLTQLISDCNFQRDALFLGEQLPTHIVDEAEQQNLLLFDWYSSAIEFTRYNSGRIFYQGAELRWERNADQFRIVYLGSAQPTAILEHYKCKAHDKCADLHK